jgi:AcrR family transcriptional regulator
MNTHSVRPRGRPAAATREEVIGAAMGQYVRGHRIDVQAIAVELGLGRATIYRWFGSREELIGEVLARRAVPLLKDARREAQGRGGAALLDTFDRFNRCLADAPPLRHFVEAERDAALRIITSGAGIVQPRIVSAIEELIDDEIRAGTYEPTVEPATLAYAIVKLAEAFLFSDGVAGIRGDVDRLREVEAALLGLGRGAEPAEPQPAADPGASGERSIATYE